MTGRLTLLATSSRVFSRILAGSCSNELDMASVFSNLRGVGLRYVEMFGCSETSAVDRRGVEIGRPLVEENLLVWD